MELHVKRSVAVRSATSAVRVSGTIDRMIVLRLPDGALLVILSDGQAVRVECDGGVKPVDALTAAPPADTFLPT